MEFVDQSSQHDIKFEPFDLSKENLASKDSMQLTSKITYITKDRESIEDCPLKTKFMNFKYSPFPTGSGKYAKPREDRNYLDILFELSMFKNNDSYDETLYTFQRYTDAYAREENNIYSQDTKKKSYYTFIGCVKTNENEITGKITTKSKLSIKPNTNYYYNNEILNDKNVKAIKQAMFADKKRRTGSDFKDYIKTLTYKINYPQDSQEFIFARIAPGEIEDRKDIIIKVHYREIEEISPDAPHPDDCRDEEELNRYYGMPREITVNSPEEMDEYCRGNSFYQFGFYAEKLWANKTKNPTTKIANAGIKFICSSLNVIRIKKYGNFTSKLSRDDLCDKYLTGKLDQRDLVSAEVNDKKPKTIEVKADSESEEEEVKPTKTVTKSKISESSKSSTEESSESEEEVKPAKATGKAVKAEPSKKTAKKESSSEESESESSESEPEPPPKPSKKKK